MHPDDRAWVDELWQQLAVNREPVDCEHRIIRPDGVVRTICAAAARSVPSGDGVLVGTAQDITEQRTAETRMLRSSQRFTDLVAVTPVGIGLFDEAERLVDANDALCDLLGFSLEQLRGRTASSWRTRTTGGGCPRRRRITAERAAWIQVIPQQVLVRADGEPVYCELHVAMSVQDDGRRFWLVVFQDITERRRAAEALRHQATHDELTGLPNRAAVNELLGAGCCPARRPPSVAVLFCDIDNFKRVNDSLGHDAGDELLVALARRLEGGLPAGCTVARLSGDEYVIICATSTRSAAWTTLATRVSTLLRTAVPVHGQLVRVTATIGAAVPNGGPDHRRPTCCASPTPRCSRPRSAARGRVSLASAALIASADRQVHLEGQLREALATDGLLLHFQPVVGPDGAIQTAEALVRWPHPDRGHAGAGRVPAGGRAGRPDARAGPMGAAHRAARGGDVAGADGKPVAVAVNLAGLVPGDPEFVDVVANAVAEAGIAWDRVVLELVETSLVDLPCRTHAADGRAGGQGRPVRGGRLRHRLLLAGPAQGPAGADHQGGPAVRGRRGQRPVRLRGRPRGGGHGPGDGPQLRRRGRGDRDAVPRAARHGRGRLPGLAVLPPGAAARVPRHAGARPPHVPRAG